MSSTAMISKSNLESCLQDSWLEGLISIPEGMEIDDLFLDIPETVSVGVKFKTKEVAH